MVKNRSEFFKNCHPVFSAGYRIISHQTYCINTFADGSGGKALLVEITPMKNYKQCFENVQRGRGEIYAIDYNGNLGLFDNQGFIRKALKIQ